MCFVVTGDEIIVTATGVSVTSGGATPGVRWTLVMARAFVEDQRCYKINYQKHRIECHYFNVEFFPTV